MVSFRREPSSSLGRLKLRRLMVNDVPAENGSTGGAFAIARGLARSPRSREISERARKVARQSSAQATARGWIVPCGLVVALALCGEPRYLRAEDFSALVMFTTNYFYRGYSKSGNEPTVRANADYEVRFDKVRAYAGTWLSRIDFADTGYTDRADVEFYPYLGLNLTLADDWYGDLSVSRYLFVGKLFGRYSDYNEYSASLHYRDLLSLRADIADDLYHRGHSGMNYEVSGRYPITEAAEVSAGFGYFGGKPAVEYDAMYWNLGFTWFWKYASLDLRYVDFAHSAPSADPETVVVPELTSKVVFSLSAGF